MSLTVAVDSVAITAGMRYPDPNHPTWTFTEAAEKGVVGTSGFDMDDPGGAGNLVGLKDIAVDESACTGHTRLFSGFLADRQIGRGMALVTGPDRQWGVAVVDSNTMLNERIIQSGVRPAETDIARITWLLGSGYIPTIHDHGLIDSTTTSMPAGDYTGRYPNDVLSDCANLSNRNFYITWDDATSQHTLAYHTADSTLNESTLRISNVRTDVDQTTTFFPSIADKMRRDPSRVYSGVFFEGNGFHIYRQNLTNGSNFRFRDVRVSDSSVGIPASATALADAYLARVGVEEDRMMGCHLEEIPAAYVNLIRAGMRIQCRFSHIPGYESFTWLRVMRRTVSSLGQGLYILDLELSNPLLTGFIATGTTPPIPTPTPPYGQPLPYVDCGFVVDLEGWTCYQGTGSFVGGVLSQIGLDNIGYWTPFPAAAAPAIRVHILLDAATTSAALMVYTGSPGSPTISEWIAVGVSGGQTYLNFSDGSLHYPGWGSVLSMWVEMTTGGTRSVAVWRDTETRADAYIISGSGSSFTPDGLAVSLGLLGGSDATGNALFTVCDYGPPTSGEYVVYGVPLEAPNGSLTTFTAPSAYAPHTLMVFVDSLRQSVTETDPAHGTFTLAFTPTSSESIVLTYTAA